MTRHPGTSHKRYNKRTSRRQLPRGMEAVHRQTDTQATRDARFDRGLEQEAREWMETVLGAGLGDCPLQEALKDGTVLCELINKIQPGTISKFHKRPTMPFKQMENIGQYLDGCKAVGVKGNDLFRTVDLFENKDMVQVVQNLFALGRAAYKVPGFTGPYLGVREVDAQPRKFTEEQLRRARAEPAQLLKGSHGGASQAGQAEHRAIVRGGDLSSRSASRPESRPDSAGRDERAASNGVDHIVANGALHPVANFAGDGENKDAAANGVDVAQVPALEDDKQRALRLAHLLQEAPRPLPEGAASLVDELTRLLATA